MKNMKKLTALMASAVLAVGAVPVGAGAENIVVSEIDGKSYMAMLDGTILDTDEKREEFRNEFFNDTTGRGDVNHDGSVDAVDANMILEYFSCLATDKYDAYTEEEHENFRKYGDVFNDGVVNPFDASWVLMKADMVSGAEILKGDINQDGVVDSADADLILDFIGDCIARDFTEEELQYYLTYGDMDGDGDVYFDDVILMGEINSDITLNTEMGDVNHDGYVNAIDATAVLCYYGDISTDNYDKYTEAQHENFRTYGNMTKDELGDDKVDALDASWILLKYVENSTTE